MKRFIGGALLFVSLTLCSTNVKASEQVTPETTIIEATSIEIEQTAFDMEQTAFDMEVIEITEDAVPLSSWMLPPSERPEDTFGIVDMIGVLTAVTLSLAIHLSFIQFKFKKSVPFKYCMIRALSIGPALMSVATFTSRESLNGAVVVSGPYTVSIVCCAVINIGIYMFTTAFIAKEAISEIDINAKKILGGLMNESRE